LQNNSIKKIIVLLVKQVPVSFNVFFLCISGVPVYMLKLSRKTTTTKKVLIFIIKKHYNTQLK